MSAEADRVLEWINLALSTFCVFVAVAVWLVLRTGRNIGSPFFPLMAGIPFTIPFLVLTSTMLLFTNRRRAMIGWGATIVSIVAMGHWDMFKD